MQRAIPLLAALVALLAAAAPAGAADLYGVTTDGHLVRFDSDSPGTLASDRPLTGAWGEVEWQGLATADGEMVLADQYGTLWVVDPADAKVKGTTGGSPPGGRAPDPRAGLTPGRGALYTVTPTEWVRFGPPVFSSRTERGPVSPAGLDLVGTAFDGERQYAIDAAGDQLVRADTPGQFAPVGPLGIDVGDSGALEIVGGRGLLVVGSSLYDLALDTGAAVPRGDLPLAEGRDVRDITLADPPHVIVNPFCCGTEGYEGIDRTWTVRLLKRGDRDQPVTFSYETARGEAPGYPAAEPGIDFEPQRGTVTLPPGEGFHDITIPIVDDDEGEEVESVRLRLTQSFGPQDKDILLFDVGDPQFTSTAVDATEGEGTVQVEVLRPTGHPEGVTEVDVSTTGTATPGADFAPPPARLTFGPGEQRKLVLLALTADDVAEGPETVRLELRAAGITRHVSDRRALTVTIADDPAAVPEQEGTDLRLLRRRIRLRRVLRIPVACYDPCTVRARLRLRVGRGPVVRLRPWLARDRATLQRRGRLRFRLGRRELARLRAAAPERVVLRIAVSDSTGTTLIRLVRVTLRRG